MAFNPSWEPWDRDAIIWFLRVSGPPWGQEKGQGGGRGGSEEAEGESSSSLWTRNITCRVTVSKGCQGHQATCQCSRPGLCTLRGFRMDKSKMLALESWDVYQRNNSSEPSLLHLSIHRKALNSFTHIRFSLINRNLLMFQLPAFCCKNLYIVALLLPLWSNPYKLRGCLLGVSPQFCLSNKT